MNDILEQSVDSAFDEGIQCERARCADLLKLLQPCTLELIRASILSGAEAVDVFDQAIALTNKVAEQSAAPEESISHAAAAVMRRAFNRASSRVNGQQRGVFSTNRVASPESA